MALEDIGVHLNDEFMAEYLVGPDIRSVVETITNTGVMLTQSEVAKRTGRLAASVHGTTDVGPVIEGDPRWIGEITMGGAGALGTVGADPHSGFWDYAASYEFGAGDHETSEATPPPRGKKLGKAATPGSTGRHHNAAAHVLDRVREELGAL